MIARRQIHAALRLFSALKRLNILGNAEHAIRQ
jgi:hypothetical protein